MPLEEPAFELTVPPVLPMKTCRPLKTTVVTPSTVETLRSAASSEAVPNTATIRHAMPDRDQDIGIGFSPERIDVRSPHFT
jgi:hypothetical protein